MNIKNLNKLIKKNEFYHSIEVNNFKIKGFYNWNPYFHLIADLIDFKKKTVLDVGPGDGYFSHKLKSLGAIVEAADIPSQKSRDNYNFGKKNIVFHSTGGKKRINNFNFEIFNKIHKDKIKIHYKNIYELSKLKKRYNIVFCNDLLLHLTDPIKAINEIVSVSKKYVIIGNPILKKSLFNLNKSEVNYLGHLSNNAYYIFNEKGFLDLINSFNLKILKKIIIKPHKKDFFSYRPRMIVLAEKI